MQAVLRGQDVVVASGTGSGKSLVFQGLALSKPHAIVLVISPLISIMEEQVPPWNLRSHWLQVSRMRELGIPAVAVTRTAQRDNTSIWQEIGKGKYRLVYASPEVILNKRGPFLGSIARGTNKFMENLIAVAVDEAHLIWDWIGFRDKFQMLGNLHLVLSTCG
jgi:superfamily II DNA helicase RecQ